jgi:hypothetical protein
MKATEYAWAAGFFDGEGHVSAQRNRTNPPVVRVSIAQVDRATLLHFRRVVGVGAVHGPRQRKNRLPYYVFDIGSSAGVEQVRRVLWPYLSAPKRRDFRRAYKEAQREF